MDDFSIAAQGLIQQAGLLTERLRQAEAAHIIDRIGTASDDALVDIAVVAAHICDVPVSTITLIDDERQYIKGMVGMSEDCRVLNRFDGICNVTIQTPDTHTIIYDASEDSRLRGLPVVDGTYDYIKFYAGIPLVTRNGYAVGSMCVIDRVPRQLRKEQLEAVARLRNIVMRLIEG